jgi:hypothetical protein
LARFIGSEGYPVAIGRKRPSTFVERRGQKWLGRSF